MYLVINILVLYVVGTPKESSSWKEHFYDIGLRNASKEVPILIQKSKIPDKNKAYTYIFLSNGISISDLEHKRKNLEKS